MCRGQTAGTKHGGNPHRLSDHASVSPLPSSDFLAAFLSLFRPSVRPSVLLFLSVRLSVCLSVFLSVGRLSPVFLYLSGCLSSLMLQCYAGAQLEWLRGCRARISGLRGHRAQTAPMSKPNPSALYPESRREQDALLPEQPRALSCSLNRLRSSRRLAVPRWQCPGGDGRDACAGGGHLELLLEPLAVLVVVAGVDVVGQRYQERRAHLR